MNKNTKSKIDKPKALSPQAPSFVQKLIATFKSMLGGINPLIVYLGLIISLFMFILLMGYFNRPISDDFAFSMANDGVNPFQFALNGYNSGNGRLGQYFTFSLYDSIFGLRKAVMVAPVINTLILAATTGYLGFVLLKRFNAKTKTALRDSVLFGALAAIVMVFSARSIFDSSLWLDSSVSYIPSLAFLMLNTALFLQLVFANKRPSVLSLGLLFGLVLAGQQFSEPTSVIVIVGFSLALLLAAVKRNGKAAGLALTGLAASIIGLLVIYFSPGSRVRRGNYHSTLDIQSMLIDSTS